jgi:phosphoglycerate dehydrogenase-like enzyme
VLQVAKWGQSFDMNVVGFDPSLPPSAFKVRPWASIVDSR